MSRTRSPLTDTERQFEVVAQVYYRLELAHGRRPKPGPASVKGFHLTSYGEGLGLSEKQMTKVRHRVQKDLGLMK